MVCFFNQDAIFLFQVRNLVLSYNQISHIDQDAFKDMLYTLQDLDLSHNKLSSIPDFPEESVLDTIDLQNNKIASLPHVFEQMPPGIRHIYMADNTIQPFQENADGAFVPLPLESLSFGPVKTFRFENLFVIRNRFLKSLRIVGAKLEIRNENVKAIRRMARVDTIELNGCSLASRSEYKHLFVPLAQRLRALSLPNNNLERVPDMIQKLHKLHSLSLSHNNIKELNILDFDNLNNLQNLYLQHNEISHVDTYTFTYLKSIRHIDLSHNALRTLRKQSFNPDRLMYITVLLSGNPWECDCDIRWIIEAVKEELEGNPGPLQAYEIHNALKCEQPPLEGIPMSEVATMYFDEFENDC